MYRVVIADDEKVFSDGLTALLGHSGLGEVIATAIDCVSAEDTILTSRPDLLLLDSGLPSVGGVALAHRLRSRHLDLPIVMLADATQVALARAAVRLGIRGIVARQSSWTELGAAMALVTKGGIHCDAVFADGYWEQDPSPTNECLTHTEMAVLAMLANGCSSKEIAHDLGLSPRTVDHVREHLKSKTGTSSLAGLIHYALKHGYAAP